MTASELKAKVNQANEESYFFTPKTMKFFGDSMRNFGVRSTIVKCNYDENGNWIEKGTMIEVWELYRKHAVKHGLKASHYFNKETFKNVYTS